jgi:hypothetical protein
MVPRRSSISIFCIALLLFATAVSANETGSRTDSRTLRASTSAAGSPLVQMATDPPDVAGTPSWLGLFVLVFGGLLSGLWLTVGVLFLLRGVHDARHPAKVELTPPNQSRREELPSADGF